MDELLDKYAMMISRINKFELSQDYDITEQQYNEIQDDIEDYFKETFKDLEFYNKVYLELIVKEREPDYEYSDSSTILKREKESIPKISEETYELCKKLISFDL